MTKIQGKSAIKVPVELAEAHFSHAVSKDSLFLLLELAAVAKPIIAPLEEVPGFRWMGEDRSKTRARARAALKMCTAELSDLSVKIKDGWQPLFDEMELENDVFRVSPSGLLVDWMVEPKRYGRVVIHEIMFIRHAATLRLIWFLAAYLNRRHRKVEITLDKIRSILGISGRYSRYSNLKSKVLDVVFGEYNKTFPKTVAVFSPIRVGRGGSVSSIYISIEDKKPEAPEPLPPRAPNERYLPVDQRFTREEELRFIKESQDTHGWVLPHFSVGATLEALAILDNDADELHRIIWHHYTPQAHKRPDSWLKAIAWVAANVAASSKPPADSISDEMLEEMLAEMMRGAASR